MSIVSHLTRQSVPNVMDQGIFEAMLDELRAFKPETIKIPARNGGYIRIPIITNCPWYREFCASYTRFRRGRDRTIIKRCHTIEALKRMQCGDRTTTYAQRLLLAAGSYELAHTSSDSENETCLDAHF